MANKSRNGGKKCLPSAIWILEHFPPRHALFYHLHSAYPKEEAVEFKFSNCEYSHECFFLGLRASGCCVRYQPELNNRKDHARVGSPEATFRYASKAHRGRIATRERGSHANINCNRQPRMVLLWTFFWRGCFYVWEMNAFFKWFFFLSSMRTVIVGSMCPCPWWRNEIESSCRRWWP